MTAQPGLPPTPEVRGINHQAVSEWLDASIDGVRGPYEFSFITGGHSNLTYLVTASNDIRLVLRRPPLGMVIATAHDMGREFKIISAINKTSVPVPKTLGHCHDDSVNQAPFYVMSYVEGVVLHDDEIASAALEEGLVRQQLSHNVIDVLANLHLADPDQIGLGDLGRKDAYLDRQLRRWQGQWNKTKTRELPAMDEAYRLLVEAKPAQRYTGVVHGDYRLGNLLIDPNNGAVQAVLDWELCTLGDVLADLGYLLNNWEPPGQGPIEGATAYPTSIGGFASRDEMIDRYVKQTGFEIHNINYYRAFQNWRLGAIIEGVLARYLQGVMGEDQADTDAYRDQVEALAEQALALLAGDSPRPLTS